MDAADTAGSESHKRESHVRNRGIRHQALDVPLSDRRDRSQEHRNDGQEGDDLAPVAFRAAERVVQDPRKQGHGRDFRRRGEKRRDRGRGTLVDVRCPHVKRSRGNLERHARANEYQAKEHTQGKTAFTDRRRDSPKTRSCRRNHKPATRHRAAARTTMRPRRST